MESFQKAMAQTRDGATRSVRKNSITWNQILVVAATDARDI